MQNNTPPADQKARDLCAIPSNRNVIVEAGAGTGKTTILIDRLCYLILGKDIPVDKIIALTFTEKAASEIKIRLLHKMQIIMAELQKDTTADPAAFTLINQFKKTKEELRKNIQNTFELAERAQISTIHSFCLHILRRYPLEAGLAPNAVVDDGALMQNIFDKQWAAFLERELAADSPDAEAWREVFKQLSLDDIKQFAFSLLTPGLEDYHPLKNAALLKQKCFDYELQAQSLLAKYDPPKKRAVETALETAAEILKESGAFFGSLKPLTAGKSIDKTPAKPVNWEENDFEKALNIINFAVNASVSNQLLFSKTFNLIKKFLSDMRETALRENILSYDAIIHKTKTLLKTNKAVRAELKKEFLSILIDEFQDTDPAQGEILLFLSELPQSAADTWRDIKLEPGKLFTVGDPKQSVYRFRGADITAYQKFTDLMAEQGALKCFLQTNFRSSARIIAFANAFGGRKINYIPAVQPEYVPINAGKNFPAQRVQIAAITAPEDVKANMDAYRHNQAQFIAAWITDNVGKTKLSNGKIMAYRDIAVLLRSTTALDIYTDALKRFDIKYTVEETKNFYTAQEINDIINILKVLNDPADKTALLGVLRSPFAMLADADILKLSEDNALNIFADVPNMPAAQSVYKTLRALYRKAGRVTLDALLDEIIYNTDFCELEALAHQKEQAAANIFKFVSVARAAQGGGALSLAQFLYYAENYSKEQKREGESPLSEESLDTVSLMTMHKAKGLEFPVVILADISKKEIARKDKRPAYIYSWEHNLQGLRLGGRGDGIFALLEQQAKAHQNAEELRILYVALTRAKERLILTGDLKDDKNTISSYLWAAGCWPSADYTGEAIPEGEAAADILRLPLQPVEEFANKQFAAQDARTINFDAAAWLGTWLRRSNAYMLAAQNAAQIMPGAAAPHDTQIRADSGSAALTGTICHAMLLSIFAGGRQSAEQAAAAQNINPAEHPEEIKQARQIIAAFEQSAIFKRLKAMPLLAAEMPFTFTKDNGQTVNGIIDAVFGDGENCLFIADYKSDSISIANIKERSAFYKPQLDLYKEALARICPGKEIKAALIYLRPAEEFYI